MMAFLFLGKATDGSGDSIIVVNASPTTSVYTFGSNEYGALGRGDVADSVSLQPVVKLLSRSIVDITCGPSSFVALTSDGALYAAGNNEDGQLCADALNEDGSRKAVLSTPLLLDSLATQPVVAASAGGGHVVVTNKAHAALSFGSNEFGALGHAITAAAAATSVLSVPPRLMKLPRGLGSSDIVQVASGHTHTLALTRGGEVLAVGSGIRGALGLGNASDVLGLTVVSALAGVPISHIAAGDNTSYAISASGVAYAWGANKYGQLGLSVAKHGAVVLHPARIETMPELVRFVAAGDSHAAWIGLSGRVYTAGRNAHGQLGLFEAAATSAQHSATVSGSSDSADAAASSTTADSNNDGGVYSLHEDAPRLVKSLEHVRIREVACGAAHTLFLSCDGQELYACGDCREGQTGVQLQAAGSAVSSSESLFSSAHVRGSDLMVAVRIPSLCGKSIFRIAAGGDHSAAIAINSGSVLSIAPGISQRSPIGIDAPSLAALGRSAASGSKDMPQLRATIRESLGHWNSFCASFLGVPPAGASIPTADGELPSDALLLYEVRAPEASAPAAVVPQPARTDSITMSETVSVPAAPAPVALLSLVGSTLGVARGISASSSGSSGSGGIPGLRRQTTFASASSDASAGQQPLTSPSGSLLQPPATIVSLLRAASFPTRSNSFVSPTGSAGVVAGAPFGSPPLPPSSSGSIVVEPAPIEGALPHETLELTSPPSAAHPVAEPSALVTGAGPSPLSRHASYNGSVSRGRPASASVPAVSVPLSSDSPVGLDSISNATGRPEGTAADALVEEANAEADGDDLMAGIDEKAASAAAAAAGSNSSEVDDAATSDVRPDGSSSSSTMEVEKPSGGSSSSGSSDQPFPSPAHKRQRSFESFAAEQLSAATDGAASAENGAVTITRIADSSSFKISTSVLSSILPAGNQPTVARTAIVALTIPGPVVLVAVATSSSLVDVIGLEAAYAAVVSGLNSDVIGELIKSTANVLDELEPHVPMLTSPDALRAFLPMLLCPAHSRPAITGANVGRICASILALPQASRDMLVAWIGEDVPPGILRSRIVKPLLAHLGYHLKLCVGGNPNGSVATSKVPQPAAAASSGSTSGSASGGASPASRAAAGGKPSTGTSSGGRSPSSAGASAGRVTSLTHLTALEVIIRVLRLLYNLNEKLAAEAQAALELPPEKRSVRVSAAIEAERRASLYGTVDRWAVPGAPLGALLPPEDFCSPDVSSLPDQILLMDYQRWAKAGYKRTVTTPIILMGYPFLLDAMGKRRVMLLESTVSMQQEANSALLGSLFSGGAGASPFLVLQVRRSHVLSDTLNQLSAQPHNLRKQLKVIFVGEEALDAGGVTKELFQLLTKELLDPVYGLWSFNEATREYWINVGASYGLGEGAMEREYYLTGILLGLSVYNGILLDIRLPLPLYRKLLGQDLSFHDLRAVHPMLASGLQQLLAYDGNDEEDVFGLTFEASFESFGTATSVELVPGGRDKAVTAINKYDYARALVDWHLNRSIATTFAALRKGFLTVVSGHSLSLLRPEELELMVAGTPELDFKELEGVTVYDGGYTPVHPFVKAFWRVAHTLKEEDKRRLLVFVTGCPKAPIGGLRNLSFKIQRNGPDTDRLPTASTCFNTLLLPEYASEAKLRDRLGKAINECTGFGLK